MSVPPRAVQLNEANAFLKDHPEVLYVDLLIADMNGVVRGKRIERTSLHKVYEKGINLPASLFALDIMEKGFTRHLAHDKHQIKAQRYHVVRVAVNIL